MMTDHPAPRARPRAYESAATLPARNGKPNARAEASRRNGARSCGPTTEEGRRQSAQNALRHGLRAQKFALLDDEDQAGFEALEEAVRAELLPEGALQEILVQRVVLAAWRMLRADRMEVDLLDPHTGLDPRTGRGGRPGGLGLALVRDGHGPRAFDTLLRYRGALSAEFWRSLRALSALKAEEPIPVGPERLATLPAKPRPGGSVEPRDVAPCPTPAAAAQPAAAAEPARYLHEPAAAWNPNEPETRGDPGETTRRRPSEGPDERR